MQPCGLAKRSLLGFATREGRSPRSAAWYFERARTGSFQAARTSTACGVRERDWEVDVQRIVVLVGICLGSLTVLAAPAQATYHPNVVNEVLLASSAGDASVQFVEFVDHGGTEEAFTPAFAPYKLVIYDAAGNKLAEQTLDPNKLRAAAAVGREYLVSTAAADAAFHVTGDEPLAVMLPQG